VLIAAPWFVLRVTLPAVFVAADVVLAGFVGTFAGWLSWGTLVATGSLSLIAALISAAASRSSGARSGIGRGEPTSVVPAPQPRSTPCPH
jgi:hypothetical protein